MDQNKSKLDNQTSISDLKEEVIKFCELRDWEQFHNPKDLAVAIITEASELLELFRFRSELECEELMKDEGKRKVIADELSDTLYFILRFAQKYDIDLTSEFYRKMKSNEAKYPVEKFRGTNKKYSEV